MVHPKDPTLSLSLRPWVCHPKTRACVGLLGPCFKTGRLKPFRQHPKPSCGTPADIPTLAYPISELSGQEGGRALGSPIAWLRSSVQPRA
jgi:hypothetical protein